MIVFSPSSVTDHTLLDDVILVVVAADDAIIIDRSIKMLRVIKVIRLSGCSLPRSKRSRESKPRKSGEKWRVDGGRKKKKKRRIWVKITNMPSGRFKKKCRKRKARTS